MTEIKQEDITEENIITEITDEDIKSYAIFEFTSRTLVIKQVVVDRKSGMIDLFGYDGVTVSHSIDKINKEIAKRTKDFLCKTAQSKLDKVAKEGKINYTRAAIELFLLDHFLEASEHIYVSRKDAMNVIRKMKGEDVIKKDRKLN